MVMRIKVDCFIGVDACNTGLGVLIFASAMNLGQSWMTFLALFGCKKRPECFTSHAVLTSSSNYDFLRPDLG